MSECVTAGKKESHMSIKEYVLGCRDGGKATVNASTVGNGMGAGQ